MEVLQKNVYFGPNPYLDRRVIYFLIDLGELKELSLQTLGPEFLSGLFTSVPGLSPPSSGHEKIKGGEPKTFSEKGLGLAKLIELLALQLQRDSGQYVEFGETHPTDVEGQYRIFYAYDAPAVGLKAGELAIRLFASLLPDSVRVDGPVTDGFDLYNEVQDLANCAAEWPGDVSSYAIQKVAGQRHIPVTAQDRWPLVAPGKTPAPDRVGVLLLGQGMYARVIRGLQIQELSLEVIAVLNDRWVLNRYLAEHNVPVPFTDPEFSNLNTASRVKRSARRIGFPVVMKPITPMGGKGVYTDINDVGELASAYAQTSLYNRKVIVEKQIPGQAFRLLIIDSKLIAASRRMTCRDSPERGGAIEDVTAKVHSEVIGVAVATASALGLDVAGIDLVTTDINRPLSLTGGAVIGIDAAPGLAFHRLPGERLPLEAAGRYLDVLFPPDVQSRIPIAAVTGTNGKTTTCRMVSHILRHAGRHVGLACTNGVYIDGVLKREGISSGISGALTIFMDTNVDTAVLETSRGTLVKKGLAFDECVVSACTNVANDHLGLDGIHTVDDMATLKRTVLEKARDMAVLNADDERCLKMIPYLKAQRICLVSSNSQNTALREQISRGGAAVVLEGSSGKDGISVYDGVAGTHLLCVDEIPATWGGAALFNVENAMFATAISMGMGVDLETIGEALRGFSASVDSTPGRLNVYDDLPFRIIIDYAHNAHGLKSLCNFVSQLNTTGCRILVMSARGDRSDENIGESAAAVAGHFDHYICRDYKDLRGRNTGEVPRLLQSGLIRQGVLPGQIDIITDLSKAVGKALTLAKAGDLVVILAIASSKEVMDLIVKYHRSGSTI